MTRRRLYELLESSRDGDKLGLVIDVALIVLIFGCVVSVILESIPTLSVETVFYLNIYDHLAVFVFSFEYFIRIWTAVENPKYRKPITGRIRYMFTPMAIVDLLAIAPFFLPILFTVDYMALRALRLFRLLRVFKLARYSQSLQMIIRIHREKKDYLLVVLFVEIVLLICVASIMYYVEHVAQPEVFATIPHAMWWAVVTLTTVGYGDVIPVTMAGKFCAGVLAIMGISLFAIPAGIIASGFNEQMLMQREKKRKKRHRICCPHCGEKFTSYSLFFADGTNMEAFATLESMKQELDQLLELVGHSVYHSMQPNESREELYRQLEDAIQDQKDANLPEAEPEFDDVESDTSN